MSKSVYELVVIYRTTVTFARLLDKMEMAFVKYQNLERKALENLKINGIKHRYVYIMTTKTVYFFSRRDIT